MGYAIIVMLNQTHFSFLMRQADKVKEFLWLGDQEASVDEEFLRKNKITHILVVGHCLKVFYPTEFHYLVVLAWDWDVEDLLRYFQSTFHFIDSARERGESILVHCRAGVSRSATIVIGYLMWKYKLSFKKVINSIKQKRSISPNDGFCFQLKQFEKLLNLPLHYRGLDFIHPIDQIGLRLSLSPSFIHHRLSRLGIEHQDQGIETFSYFTELKEKDAKSVNCDFYRCKNCKKCLFTDFNFVPSGDKEVEEELSLVNLKVSPPIPCSDTCEFNEFYFIESMAWMLGEQNRTIKTEKQGILLCSCHTELGSWNWTIPSSKCASGCKTRIGPQMKISKEKIAIN